MTNLAGFVDYDSQLSVISLCHLRAATSTYNALLLNNYSYESQTALAETVFLAAINKLTSPFFVQ